MGNRLRDFLVSYARPDSKLSNWKQDDEQKEDSDIISLAEVVENVRPTVLIGTSTSQCIYGTNREGNGFP
jgi:malic enzyme